MPNDFYTPSGSPATSSALSSSTIRAEFSSIESGFNKLPALSTNADKLLFVNAAGTAIEARSTLVLSSAGPHSFGGGAATEFGFRLTGTYAPSGSGTMGGFMADHTITGVANATMYVANIGGQVNEAGSGTHALLAGLRVAPSFGLGGAATTTMASLALIAPVGGAGVVNAANLYLDGGASGATNNYAIWAAGGSLRFDGVGPHSVGGAPLTYSAFTIRGTFVHSGGSPRVLDLNNATLNPAAGENGYIAAIGGSTINKAGSGTHAEFAGVIFGAPTIGAGASTLTTAATVKINAAPTGASTNYALWVAGGESRFDGVVTAAIGDLRVGATGIDASIRLAGTNNWDLFHDNTADTFAIRRNSSAFLTIASTLLFAINDTSNANMTVGLTINQGGADDEILSLKSSDIAHGMTGATETDTFASLLKASQNAGGLMMIGYTSATTSLYLIGRGTTDDTTKATNAIGYVHLMGQKKSGASPGAAGANANLVVITNNGTTTHIFDADGDSHQDVGTAWTNFDDRDDVLALDALSALVSREGDPLREAFGGWMNEHRKPLEDARIVTFNDDGHHFINWSRTHMLEIGAIRQLGRDKADRSEVAAIEQRMMALQHQVDRIGSN